MRTEKIITHRVAPGEALQEIVDKYVSSLPEKSILVITSKIMSICQNRIIAKEKITDKFELIQQEADLYLKGGYSEKYGIWLTIKNGILIPTAGIDESNGNGNYILYPINISQELAALWTYIKTKHSLNEFGLLLTDSHTTPLRRGVTGIALGWCGFKALHNYIGTLDIYGQPLRVTQLNIIDSLAAAAVFDMGEGNEQCPLVLISDLERIVFQARSPTPEELEQISIPIAEDIYAPLIATLPWQYKKIAETEHDQ